MRDDSKRVNERRLLHLGVVLLATAAALLAPGVTNAEGEGRCATAQVPGPIVLPDGSVQPAGKLTLCLSRSYSPVAGLHKTSVDGHVIGLFVSRRGTSEMEVTEHVPFFVFLKDGEGRYELQSYSWPSDDRYLTFDVNVRSRVKSHWMANSAADRDQQVSVLIAGY